MKAIQFLLVLATAAVVSIATVRWMGPRGVRAQSPTPGTFAGIPPCRVVDTRWDNGPFGGPIMEAGETRQYALASNNNCNTPAPSLPAAAAYALNVTVVPDGPLEYLTIWGFPGVPLRPNVSTQNSWDGQVVANGTIVMIPSDPTHPTHNYGVISVYVTNRTHVIIDALGYFTGATL